MSIFYILHRANKSLRYSAIKPDLSKLSKIAKMFIFWTKSDFNPQNLKFLIKLSNKYKVIYHSTWFFSLSSDIPICCGNNFLFRIFKNRVLSKKKVCPEISNFFCGQNSKNVHLQNELVEKLYCSICLNFCHVLINSLANINLAFIIFLFD